MNHFFHAYKPQHHAHARHQLKNTKMFDGTEASNHNGHHKSSWRERKSQQRKYQKQQQQQLQDKEQKQNDVLDFFVSEQLQIHQLFGKHDPNHLYKGMTKNARYGFYGLVDNKWYWNEVWLLTIIECMFGHLLPVTDVIQARVMLQEIQFAGIHQRMIHYPQQQRHANCCCQYCPIDFLCKWCCRKKMLDSKDMYKQCLEAYIVDRRSPTVVDFDHVFVVRDIASVVYMIQDSTRDKSLHVQVPTTSIAVVVETARKTIVVDKNNNDNKNNKNKNMFYENLMRECCQHLIKIYSAARTDNVEWFDSELLSVTNHHVMFWIEWSLCFHLALVVACEFQSCRVLHWLLKLQHKNKKRSKRCLQYITDIYSRKINNNNVLKQHSLEICKPLNSTNVFFGNGVCMRHACWNGNVSVVQCLAETLFPNEMSWYDDAMSCAAARGHVEIIEILLEKNAKATNWTAIRLACLGGHVKIVQRLLKVQWQHVMSSHQLSTASVTTCKAVMPSAAQEDFIICLRIALLNNHIDIVVVILTFLESLPFNLYDCRCLLCTDMNKKRCMARDWQHIYRFKIDTAGYGDLSWLVTWMIQHYYPLVFDRQQEQQQVVHFPLGQAQHWLNVETSRDIIETSCIMDEVSLFARPDQTVSFFVPSYGNLGAFLAWPNETLQFVSRLAQREQIEKTISCYPMYGRYVDLCVCRKQWFCLKQLWREWLCLETCIEQLYEFHSTLASTLASSRSSDAVSLIPSDPMIILSRICQQDVEVEMARLLTICRLPTHTKIPQLSDHHHNMIHQWAVDMRTSVFWTDVE